MSRFFAALLSASFLVAPALSAQDIAPRDGWVVIETDSRFVDLVKSVIAATKANGMGVVTQAGPTKAAAARGITIPGNRVIGVFNNDIAVRMLEQSPAAMIEAPVRFYVTESPDGTATLSYKTPSHVFAPYVEDGTDVAAIAQELDTAFATIAAAATGQSH